MKRVEKPLFLILLSSAFLACSCPSERVREISLVSYNLMTLFDPVDDGGEYPEFSILDGKYSDEKYCKRLASFAKVLDAIKDGGPDILAVQEIENSRVLLDLGNLLDGYAYHACADDTDATLECGILSRYPITAFKAHRVMPPYGSTSVPRLLLEADIDIQGQKLVLLVAHWKSKLGGAEETEPERIAAAGLAGNIMRERLMTEPGLAIVLAGDLNEGPDEGIIAAYPAALPGYLGLCDDRELVLASADSDYPLFFNPWAEAQGYSYRYAGKDERIDNIFLSPSLVRASGPGLRLIWFDSAPPRFAITAKGVPIAYRADSGEGFSDHLPILAKFIFAP